MNVEVTGEAVPRFSRREIAQFVRTVMLTLEKMDRLGREVEEVSIAFVPDREMTSLNRKFRGKNKTTDVLTFSGEDNFLGDIVVSIDQARKQAIDEKHSLATEVRYLILHGILHALGYDHETDKGEMNALEVEVRERVGLA